MPDGLRISDWKVTLSKEQERKVKKMNETKVYEDGFRAVFTKQDDFLSCINKISSNSFWERRKSKQLRLIPLMDGSKVAEDLKMEYEKEGIDKNIISDTILNTGLLIRLKDKCYPVRACAIKSILDRAGISGNGLRRLEKNVYARILNDCLKVTSGEALVRISEGKVSAVLGGDCHDYSVLDTEQIFLHSVDYLNQNFKGCQYLGGFYEHDMVSALWELSGNDELLDAYRDEMRIHGKSLLDMKPMVRITTSDTGMGGANIYPMLVADNGRCTINLGSPLRLGHRNGTKISDFDDQLKMLYGKYQVATGNLAKLLDIDIMHPINCMKGVMDKLGIAKKYKAEAVDLFLAQYGADTCTAHDIYFGISEILYILSCEGEDGSKIARMEEIIARALAISWTEYDVPGTYAW